MALCALAVTLGITTPPALAGAAGSLPKLLGVGPPSSSQVSFWAGENFLPNGTRDLSVYTPALWALLAHDRVPIYLNLRYRYDFAAPVGQADAGTALSIIQQANSHGVPVWAWIVVPSNDGYYAWQGNASEQLAAEQALRSWQDANHLTLAGVAFDPEPPGQWYSAFYGALAGTGAAGFAQLETRTIDPAAQCASIVQYNAVYDWASSHFAGVVAAPWPVAVDDVLDSGTIALQSATGYWGLPRGAQALYFQAYRSVFADIFGVDPGSSLVASYFERARHLLGAVRGQVTLGVAGDSTYKTLAPLVNDVRLVAALGASSIPIYSLEYAVQAYGLSGVEQLVQAGHNPLAHRIAEQQARPSPQSLAISSAIRALVAGVVMATPAVTASRGAPQLPNLYPEGCGGSE